MSWETQRLVVVAAVTLIVAETAVIVWLLLHRTVHRAPVMEKMLAGSVAELRLADQAGVIVPTS
ncbi:MAG: hypothetical protein DMD91_25990 [Candidatus Rokuibacteriota bacterium]|nr:MAG: hypothetical protein DMD91_25990 [Candidatus Rokubacteria bacterium]